MKATWAGSAPHGQTFGPAIRGTKFMRPDRKSDGFTAIAAAFLDGESDTSVSDNFHD